MAIVGFVDSSSISAIAEYNRAPTDTKLRVVRYEPVYDGGVIYIETAREAFEQDLADGRIPDIMIVDMDTHVNISDYESSLPLCDLYELMDDDYREIFCRLSVTSSEQTARDAVAVLSPARVIDIAVYRFCGCDKQAVRARIWRRIRCKADTWRCA